MNTFNIPEGKIMETVLYKSCLCGKNKRIFWAREQSKTKVQRWERAGNYEKNSKLSLVPALKQKRVMWGDFRKQAGANDTGPHKSQQWGGGILFNTQPAATGKFKQRAKGSKFSKGHSGPRERNGQRGGVRTGSRESSYLTDGAVQVQEAQARGRSRD